MLPPFSYVRPRELQEALSHLEAGDAAVHAGGTDLLPCLRDGVIRSGKIVSISALRDLAGIAATAGGGLVVGALTTITDLAAHPLVQKKFPGLARAAVAVASPQLRNQGTLGGNLCQKPRCWYYRGEFHCLRKGGDLCYAKNGENQFHAIFGHDNICFITHPSDTAPALIALGARARLAGPLGDKRTIAVEDLHVKPKDSVRADTVLRADEIITHLEIPPPATGLYTSYRKIRTRRSWDFALAGAALALEMDGDRVIDGRVVLSGAAPIPWRSLPAEQALRGRRLTPGVIEEAARAAVAKARPMSGNGYKVAMFRGLLEEELATVHRRISG